MVFLQIGWAGSWYLPQQSKESVVQILNQHPQHEAGFDLIPAQDLSNPISESSFGVMPRSQESLDESWLPSEHYTQIKGPSSSLIQVQVLPSLGSNHPVIVPSGESRMRSITFKRPTAPNADLVVQNLSSTPQDIHIWISVISRPQHIRVTLGAFEKSWGIRIPQTATKIQIEGEHNLNAWILNDSGEVSSFLPPQKEPLSGLNRNPESAYFRLENPSGTQSYIVELKDPKLIREARNQIQNPNTYQARILIGEISPGGFGLNQDHHSPHQRTWSWHVSKVIKFAEFASQSCDGSPEFVEDYLLAWLDSGLPICFWSYHIKAEL